MPIFNMGDVLKIDSGNMFVQLKSKGDKIKFRLIKGGYYDGKHFIKDGDSWVVSYCPRIMEGKDCLYCQKYAELKTKANSLEDKNDKEKALKEARQFQSKITFYYPVIDREDKKGRILKTTLGIRQKLEDEFKNGVDVYEYDYILTRTENSPSDYYSLIRLDSKQCEELSEDEVSEVKKMSDLNLEEIITGVKKSSQDFKKEEEVIVPDEDLPF